jgi:large subunit ribosomal protein L17
MRHRNNVRQLGRSHSHRKAMYNNMVTSFFEKERIITTKEKGKELKRISERLITRAKKSLVQSDNKAGILHDKREVMKVVKDEDVVKKLFDKIAPRFKDRNGGYTRLYLLGKRRAGDAAEMALVELVVREKVEKDKDKAKPPVKAKDAEGKEKKKVKEDKKKDKDKEDKKKDKKEK